MTRYLERSIEIPFSVTFDRAAGKHPSSKQGVLRLFGLQVVSRVADVHYRGSIFSAEPGSQDHGTFCSAARRGTWRLPLT